MLKIIGVSDISKFIGVSTFRFLGNSVNAAFTKLLLKMNGANNSTNFIEETGKIVTNNGAYIATGGKIDGSSGYFSNSFITLPTSPNCDFGSGDFTIDFWVYPGYLSNLNTYDTYFYFQTFGIYRCRSGYSPGGNVLHLDTRGAGVGGDVYPLDYTPVREQWSHWAFVRQGNELKFYANGILIKTITPYFGNFIGGDLKISSLNVSWYDSLKGSISFFRASNKALWTSNFNPPITHEEYYSYPGLTPISNNILPGSVKLFMKMNYVNDVSTFVDETGKSVVNSSAGIIKTDGKIGGSCGSFAAGSYLTIPSSSDWAFGDENFTIDYWFKPTVYDNTYEAYLECVGSWSIARMRTGYPGYGGLVYFYYAGKPTVYTNFAPTGVGSWVHFAVVRNGTSLLFFVNGALNATVPYNLGTISTTGTLRVSAPYDPYWVGSFRGNMNYLRIIKGHALWTSAFTPPSTYEDYYYFNSKKLL